MSKPKQPEQHEIDEVLNWCADAAERGRSTFWGMTFEQGVEAAIRWLTEGGERPDTE